jgi:Na+/proline symporter
MDPSHRDRLNSKRQNLRIGRFAILLSIFFFALLLAVVDTDSDRASILRFIGILLGVLLAVFVGERRVARKLER